MDLSQLDTRAGAEEGAELVLLHPQTREPTDIVIRLRGEDSEAYQTQVREFQRKKLDQARRTRRVTATPEEIEAEALELLVVATIGWNDSLTRDGQPYPYTPANARRLYEQFPWIREQVDEFVRERANFLPRSARG